MYWYLVLALVISQYSDAFPTEPKSNEPSFCRGLECPAYKVMMKTADFEERCYAEYKWASTDMSGNAVFTSESIPNFSVPFLPLVFLMTFLCD